MNKSDLPPIFSELIAIYNGLENSDSGEYALCIGCGECCDFNHSGHKLYLSLAEALYMVHSSREGLTEDFLSILEKGLCPYQIQNKCTNREGRSIGCRVFFCKADGNFMQEKSNAALDVVKAFSKKCHLEWIYGELVVMLTAAYRIIERISREENDVEMDIFIGEIFDSL
mgnify:CR=1 FL=1